MADYGIGFSIIGMKQKDAGAGSTKMSDDRSLYYLTMNRPCSECGEPYKKHWERAGWQKGWLIDHAFVHQPSQPNDERRPR